MITTSLLRRGMAAYNRINALAESVLQWEMWTRKLVTSSTTRLQQSVPRVAVSEDKRKLTIQCEGEQERRFHGVWLRHNCRCPICTSVYTGQTIVDPKQLMKDLKLEVADIKGDQVNVQWSVSGNTVHSGSFPLDWLKDKDYSSPKPDHRNKPLVAETLSEFSYDDVMMSDDGLYQWLLHLNHYGASLVKNVPIAGTDELTKLIQRVGLIQGTIDGKILIKVEASETPNNEADTNNALLLHMDQGFYENTPGLLFLHAIKFDKCVEGGESILLDTYPIVEELRRKHPKQFDTLTRVSVPVKRLHYSKERNVDYVYGKKIIALDEQNEIVAINWHPQLLGTIQVKEDEMEDFYDAFIMLAKMFDDSQLKLVHRLQPGEVIAFNNRRFLHSRASFKQNGGRRMLMEGYCTLDDFRSRFLTLRKVLGKTDTPRPILNGSSYW